MNFKKYDVLKKGTAIYLVDSFHKFEDIYRLKYFFKTTLKLTDNLYINNSRDFHRYELKNLKQASKNDIEILFSKIKTQYPTFDLTNIPKSEDQNKDELNEDLCIEFLKNKGYLVFKQV